MASEEDKSTKRALRLIPLSEIILYRLYEAHISDDLKDKYSFEDIQLMLKEQVSRKLISSAITHLMGKKYEQRPYIGRSGKSGEYTYFISIDGIFQVEKQLNRGNSIANCLLNNPDVDLKAIAGFDGIFYTPQERIDVDQWKPLPIDRETESFKRAIKDVENALEIIRGDNGFAEELPETRNGIVENLTEGIQKLKTGKTTVQRLKSLIIAPLQWVAATFGNTLIGTAAKNAAEGLYKYILSLLS